MSLVAHDPCQHEIGPHKTCGMNRPCVLHDGFLTDTAKARAPAKNEKETALQEAQRLVHGDRGADYGHPIDDYTRTGRMWGAILGIGDIDPRICCLMMAAVKISRECNKPKRDNRVDLAGYAECANMIAERQESAALITEGE